MIPVASNWLSLALLAVMRACRMGEDHATSTKVIGKSRSTSWNSHRYMAMNKRSGRGRGKLHVHSDQCRSCTPALKYSLMSNESERNHGAAHK